ncbi:MAG: membrane dipeptidase [Clostridia bacterium]|nr:membrane dipeptidase [Clostridia bacterium]
MKVFDLHCDTITECCKNNVSLYDNDMHLSLNRMQKFDEYTQVFAVWIRDEMRGDVARQYFDEVADYFYEQIAENDKTVSVFGSNSETKVKAILSVEGGSACGGTLDGLTHLFNRGVKLITLTWNSPNEIASGAFSEGGFTAFGKDFVKLAEEYGIILDVSHLNRESFYDFIKISDKPFVASHSNADIVENPKGRKRNLTDDQIKLIKERDGIIGLNFCRNFLESDGFFGIDSLVRQIDYFLSLGCENNIALGSDYDGCSIHSDFIGVEKMEEVYKKLNEKGYRKALLDKIFYGNARRFFEDNI